MVIAGSVDHFTVNAGRVVNMDIEQIHAGNGIENIKCRESSREFKVVFAD